MGPRFGVRDYLLAATTVKIAFFRRFLACIFVSSLTVSGRFWVLASALAVIHGCPIHSFMLHNPEFHFRSPETHQDIGSRFFCESRGSRPLCLSIQPQDLARAFDVSHAGRRAESRNTRCKAWPVQPETSLGINLKDFRYQVLGVIRHLVPVRRRV